MKELTFSATAFLILVFLFGTTYAKTELTEQYQQDLMDRFNHLHGDGPIPESMENLDRPICGTQTAFEYFLNHDRLSGVFKTMAIMDGRDTTLSYSYVSPAEHFTIHYDISGTDAVYMPSMDTLDGGDGVPDYVNKTAEILDSVWTYCIDVLGFPPPPRDDFYAIGLDSTYDVYINSLGSAYYGATYSEAIVDSQRATSYLSLDNDYNFAPYNEYTGDPRDFNRRLDAVRVTAAHEFFHAIHFGMDWTEWEGDDPGTARIYWWEMSAVWMEEMMYDSINDYYGYLPAFFNLPWVGLRNFNTSSYPLAIHPYGSVVFPIFLTEKWNNPIIVRRIWEECRDLGVGPQFGEAVEIAVNEASGGTYHLTDAIREFSVWNIFTGSRAVMAPDGIGYSEKEFYPAIPDSAIFSFDSYPVVVTNQDLLNLFGAKITEMFGANIINFENTFTFPDSFNMSFYSALMFPNPDWNVSLIGIPIDDKAKAVVQMNHFDGPNIEFYSLPNSAQLLNVMAIVSPSLVDVTSYDYRTRFKYSFAVNQIPIPIDSARYYTFKAPYPNPCTASPPCDNVTFAVEKSFTDLNPPSGLSVTIYTVAGEKIRELQTSQIGNLEISVDWDLTNESGYEVASGVYFIYWRLNFEASSGTENITHKSKIALLK